MKIKVGENKRPYTIEPGVLQSTLTRIDDVGVFERKFGNKQTHVITFELDRQYKAADGRMTNMTVNGMYHITMDERSNFYKMVSGILGRKLAVGEEFDTDSLLGKRCMVVVEKNKQGFPVIGNTMPVMDALPPMTVQNLPPDEWITKRMSPTTSNAAMR